MATKKNVSMRQRRSPAAQHQHVAYERLHTLLHTVRSIAHYEDVLCEITHEAKRLGDLSAGLSREVAEILEKIPSDTYLSDLNAVRSVLVTPQSSSKRRSKKSVESYAPKKNAVAKRAQRRSSE